MGLFIQHACKQNLMCAENCVECFHSEFLVLGYTVHKIRMYGTDILLVCLKQLASCMLLRQYVGLWGVPNFGLK